VLNLCNLERIITAELLVGAVKVFFAVTSISSFRCFAHKVAVKLHAIAVLEVSPKLYRAPETMDNTSEVRTCIQCIGKKTFRCHRFSL